MTRKNSRKTTIKGRKPRKKQRSRKPVKNKIKPVKRNNRRYYQRQDLLLIRQIRSLLYDQGFTIVGARQWLKGGEASEDSKRYRQLLKQTITELESIRDLLKTVR